mmetsp:Transcript_15966/g.24063  ORF Transcript_15966/g.24063 Transcript_15966/m.24063 type:complete len:208 (+) Transcript_15966:208-831(+)
MLATVYNVCVYRADVLGRNSELNICEVNCATCGSEFIELTGQGVEEFLRQPDTSAANTVSTDDENSPAALAQQLQGLAAFLPLGRGNPIESSFNTTTRLPSTSLPDGHSVVFERLNSEFTSLDNLLHHLLMNEQSHASGQPASESAISNLERRTENIAELGECCISQDRFSEDDVAVIMPCGHAYKEQLIVRWLQQHNSCPVCRVSI